MTTAAQAAKLARELGKQLKAVIEVSDFLGEIGDLEQATSEAKRAVEKAQQQRTVAQEELDVLDAQVQAEKTSLADTKVEKQKLSQEMKQFAAQKVAAARTDATKIVAVATEEANKVFTEATSEVHALEQKRDSLLRNISQLQAEFTKLRRNLDNLLTKLE